jgi:hypothetical protein
MNFGIVVEGEQDSAAYPELIRKIRDDIESIFPIPCGGVGTLKKEFINSLKQLPWRAPHPIDRALVIMDSDCSDAFVWEEQLGQIYEQSHFKCNFPVRFHATKCKLETWLLADENAVNQVSQQRGKNKKVAAVTFDLETHKEAKELFHKQLSKADLRATAPVYKEIASFSDIARISARCPNFRQFANKIRAL